MIIDNRQIINWLKDKSIWIKFYEQYFLTFLRLQNSVYQAYEIDLFQLDLIYPPGERNYPQIYQQIPDNQIYFLNPINFFNSCQQLNISIFIVPPKQKINYRLIRLQYTKITLQMCQINLYLLLVEVYLQTVDISRSRVNQIFYFLYIPFNFVLIVFLSCFTSSPFQLIFILDKVLFTSFPSNQFIYPFTSSTFLILFTIRQSRRLMFSYIYLSSSSMLQTITQSALRYPQIFKMQSFICYISILLSIMRDFF